MLSTPRFVASAVLGLGLATACSSTTESTAPSNVDVQAYSSGQCDFFVRCQPYVIDNTFGTKDACTSMITAALSPELTLKGVSLSQAQAQACQTQQTTQSCDDPTAPTDCQFKGTLANDAACAVDLQCASGNCYFPASADGTTTTCGTCKAFVAEGGDCTDGACEPGLNCNTASKCVKGAAEGAGCTDAFDCAGSLQCVAGKCVPLFGEGAACKPLDTASGVCDRNVNLYCKPTIADGSTGVCAKYAYAAVGQACGIDRTTFLITSCTASQCVLPTSDAIAGTCTAPLAAGAACSTTSVGCAFGLTCSGGVCTAPDLASCNP